MASFSRVQIVAVALTAPLLLTVAACGSSATAKGGSPRPGHLVLAAERPSQGFEGDKCISDLQTNPMIYDALLRIKVPNGDGVVPGLAKSYSYDEKAHVYTFDLRPDAKFSNGKPVTAKDVVFSFNQWTSGPVSGSYYANVKSAEAVSDTEVKVTMKQGDTFLPALLTWCTSTVYPDNFGGESKADYFKTPISAGAFAVKSTTDLTGPSEVIQMIPNKYYYGYAGKTPPFKSFEWRVISDPSQRVLQFKAGDVDLLDSVDSAAQAQVGKQYVQRSKPDQISGMLANTKSGPTADADLRAAISAAVDRSEVVQAQNDGNVAATGALPIDVPGAVEPTTPYSTKADLTQAKALLAKSKYPKGVSIDYLYSTSDKDAATAAQMVKSQLAKIGVNLNLQATDNTTLYARLSAKNFQMANFRASAISPTIFDPISYLQAAAYPYTGADHTVVDRAFATGTSTTDTAVQEAQAKAVQDDVLKQNFYIGVYNSRHAWAVQPWVKGFLDLQYGFFYGEGLSSK